MAYIKKLFFLLILLLGPGLTMNASAGLVCPDGVICDGDDSCAEECDDGDLNADAPNACRTDCTFRAVAMASLMMRPLLMKNATT